MNMDEGASNLHTIYSHVHSPVCDTASFDVWNEQAISWFAIPGSYKKINDNNMCVNQDVAYSLTE